MKQLIKRLNVQKNQGYEVVSFEYIADDERLYVRSNNEIINYNIMLDDIKSAIMQGKIVFRSKDYVFTTDDGHEIYGEPLKANQLQGNKILLDNSIYYTLKL